MKVLYFTGTGNSLYVAKQFDGQLYSIPQVLRNKEFSFEDEKIGIVFPCYAHSTPAIVFEFIRKATLNSPYIFAVMTYGSLIGSSVRDFVSYARNHGIIINYSNRLLMVDNYLPLFDMKKEKRKDKHINENLKSIIDDVSSGKEYHYRGSFFAPLLTKMAHIAAKALPSNSPKQFKISSDCNACGICAKVCPRSNIMLNINNGSAQPEFGNTCEFCLACANLCPQNAIKLKTDKNPNARFINENVNLKDIIDSNNGETL